MELRVDSSHDMINLEGLDLSSNKKINVSMGSTDLDLFVFSGSKKQINNEVEKMVNDNNTSLESNNVSVR